MVEYYVKCNRVSESREIATCWECGKQWVLQNTNNPAIIYCSKGCKEKHEEYPSEWTNRKTREAITNRTSESQRQTQTTVPIPITEVTSPSKPSETEKPPNAVKPNPSRFELIDM